MVIIKIVWFKIWKIKFNIFNKAIIKKMRHIIRVYKLKSSFKIKFKNILISMMRIIYQFKIMVKI